MVVVVGVAEAAAVADGGFDAEAVSDWGFDAEAVSDWGFDAEAVPDWFGFDAEVVFDWGFDVFDAEACCVPGADVGAEQESTDAFGAQAARNGTRPMKTKSINN